MSLNSSVLLSLSAAATLISTAGAQTPRQLTARELFYSAVDTPKTATPAVKPAPKKAPPAKRPSPPRTEIAQAETRAPEPVGRPVTETPSTPIRTPDGTPVVRAATAPAPSAGPALGLKYAILKKDGDRSMDVPADTVFHSGDRIQFSVETNGAGYLYIVSQGSSGTWKPMFPAPEVEKGDNRVEGFHTYTMPPGSRILFDEQKGIERVFIVFSREPEPDLERMIYSLQAPKKPTELSKPKQMLVATNVDDKTIGRLRSTYSRDLIIEKVDPSNSGERKENAMYVVNPTGSSDSRLVADLSLVHQ
jgi:hypothetical protein